MIIYHLICRFNQFFVSYNVFIESSQLISKLTLVQISALNIVMPKRLLSSVQVFRTILKSLSTKSLPIGIAITVSTISRRFGKLRSEKNCTTFQHNKYLSTQSWKIFKFSSFLLTSQHSWKSLSPFIPNRNIFSNFKTFSYSSLLLIKLRAERGLKIEFW